MSIKAIILGTLLSIVIFLSGQLVYILLAAFIGSSANEYTAMNEYKTLLWFCLSAATFAISFILGGLFTSILTDKKKVLHAAIVGFLVAAISILSAGDLSALNYKALIMLVAGLGFSALGGRLGTKPTYRQL